MLDELLVCAHTHVECCAFRFSHHHLDSPPFGTPDIWELEPLIFGGFPQRDFAGFLYGPPQVPHSRPERCVTVMYLLRVYAIAATKAASRPCEAASPCGKSCQSIAKTMAVHRATVARLVG